ncbi:MAG: N-acetylmuramoyl-L-alanine amidase [Candidatus Omnitrophota bacterium]|nr:N-acetylmuramoyl-L-alanine amidase [Candidatus Omnitrophota bacterium]
MTKLTYKYFRIILSIICAVAFLSGCAAQVSHFRLDASLAKDIRMLDGSGYIALDKICDFYSLDYKYDSFTRTATIHKGLNRLIIRAEGERALVNGEMVKLDKPAALNGNILFVPLSFVRNNLGPVIGYTVPARLPAEEARPKKWAIRTIIIDPGHGGSDPGAIGRRRRVKEKDLTLRLARKLKYLLEAADIKAVMTRDSDIFIPLPRRSEIANKSAADLFVSVHINASRNKGMRGFECYYLSNATDDNARALEAFENSSLKVDEEASAEHSRSLDKTLWDMTLTENRLESAELAGYICDSVDESLLIGNRGIRSARFYVLKHTNLPAVLVETGYMSNKFEELKLKDPDFLDRMAEAIAKGILRYKKEYERTEGFTK